MGSISIHKLIEDLDKAANLFLKAKAKREAELWKVKAGGKSCYAVILRVKRRGRNPKIELLKRLDAECPECGGPALVVWSKSGTSALKCLKGHYRKNGKGKLELTHPVFLV